jgi:formylglycine-generating enzyme required for sulfatase activity
MVYLGNNVWVDIYQASDDTRLSGDGGTGGFLSVHNAMPSIGLTWYSYVEMLLLSGKRLLTYQEWIQAALGSPQGTPSGNLNAWTAGSDRQVTGFVERAVSSVGCRDCVGNVWEWLSDLIASGSGTEAWQDPMSGQGYGQMWLFEDNNFRALLAGGSYFNGALVGARSACVLYNPWGYHASFGARGACGGI